MKLTNFYLEDNIHQDFKILASREGRTIKDILTELIEDYLKAHMDGNPQHLMDNFLKNEDFTGFPSMAIDLKNKKEYAKNLKDKQLAQELFNHVCEWYGILQ